MQSTTPEESDDSRNYRERVASRLGAVTPSFVSKRYAAKFALAILAVILVISLIGGWSYTRVNGLTRENAVAQLNTTGTTQADAINEWVVSMRAQAKLISGSDTLATAQQDAKITQALQQSLRQTTGTVKRIYLLDTSTNTVTAGVARGSQSQSLTGKKLGEIHQPWQGPVSRVSQYSTVSSLVTLSNNTYRLQGESVMAFASPVPDSESVVIMVGSIQGKIEQIQNAKTDSETRILNAKGRSVLGANGSAQEAFSYAETEAFQNALNNGTAGLHRTDNKIQAYASVPAAGWVMVTEAQKSDIYAVSQTVGQSVLLIIGSGLLSLVTVSAILGRQTVVPLARLRERAARMESGDLDVDLQTRREDEIGRLYEGFASMRDALQEQIQEAENALAEAKDARADAEAAREEAEYARQEAEEMNDHLEQKADEYSTILQQCADGDLTCRLDTESESEAMKEIATEVNAMLDQWEATIVSIRKFADDVDESSGEATESIDDIRDASARVSDSTQKITETLQEQDEHVDDVSRQMSNLSATIQEITSTSESVARRAEQTAERGDTGQKAAESALADLDAIEEQTSIAVEAVDKLAGRIDEIGEIVEFITDIADQTNILALNANIEAARAGEAGEGFGVVANEVKSLAEETKDATEEIEQLVTNIRKQTDTTVEDMQKVSKRVDNGTKTVEEALNALDEIAQQARETNRGVQEIRTATQEQADAAQGVARLADQVAELSEKTTSETENVAASAEQQAAQVDTIAQQISRLSTRATELRDQMDQFNVSETESTRTERTAEAVD